MPGEARPSQPRPPELSVGDALARVGETFSRLVVQHLQLLRSELECEARRAGERGRSVASAVVQAMPFLIGGIAIASLGCAQLLGLCLAPWLGRAAGPLLTVAVGLLEAGAAGVWLRRGWKRAAGGLPRTASKNEIATRSDDGAPTIGTTRSARFVARRPERVPLAAEGELA